MRIEEPSNAAALLLRPVPRGGRWYWIAASRELVYVFPDNKVSYIWCFR